MAEAEMAAVVKAVCQSQFVATLLPLPEALLQASAVLVLGAQE
jgi:hypothetical protein